MVWDINGAGHKCVGHIWVIWDMNGMGHKWAGTYLGRMGHKCNGTYLGWDIFSRTYLGGHIWPDIFSGTFLVDTY